MALMVNNFLYFLAQFGRLKLKTTIEIEIFNHLFIFLDITLVILKTLI